MSDSEDDTASFDSFYLESLGSPSHSMSSSAKTAADNSSDVFSLTTSDSSSDSDRESDDSAEYESEAQNDEKSEGEISAESEFEEDEENDIFEDAKEHLELLIEQGYEFVNASEYLHKEEIFKEPPGLLDIGEYKIAVAKFIVNGISWKDTASVLFKVNQHSEVEKTVRQLYFTALAELVQQSVAELITIACCSRDKEFFESLKLNKKLPLTSDFWEDLVAKYMKDYDKKDSLFILQLINLKDVEYEKKDDKTPKDKYIQKLWKKIVASWLQLINTLVPHFFDDSVERELLSCLFNWFSSGEMSYTQFHKWKNLFKEGNATNVNELRDVTWKDKEHAKEHISLFVSLLDNLETDELLREEEFKELLDDFLSEPTYQFVEKETRMQVIGKGCFLSDILNMEIGESVKEVDIYAKYFLGIDWNLKNDAWHGRNLAIVTDKLTVWEKSVIDVSGTGYSQEVRGSASNGRYTGCNGDDGKDGQAGESSGNVVILANQLRNPEKLTIKLNGGSGEGGQNGGAGVGGKKGTKITKDSFEKTILHYNSLYRDSWSSFEQYNPGNGWTKISSKSVNDFYTKWIYREYTHDDGRKMSYSYSGDCGYFYTTYDIMFFIKGTDGSMGGSGGRNGVSGEGGNAGDFKVRSLKTGVELKGFNVEIKKGEDGINGTPGTPGNPGENGNDMAMVDHSSGGMSWSNRQARNFHGGSEKDQLTIAYECSQTNKNALNGFKKHNEKTNYCYTHFSTKEIASIGHTKATETKMISERSTKSEAVSKQTISIGTLLEEFAEFCEGHDLNIGDISEFKEFEADEEEEQEEEEQVQEEISVIRTLVEDSQEYEKNLQRSMAKPEEVIQEIKRAVANLDQLKLVDLISLWKRIFSVPLDVDQLKIDLDPLLKLLHNGEYVKKSFGNHRTLSNGMTAQDVSSFLEELSIKFEAKQKLTRLEMKLDLAADGSKDLEMKNDELSDVVASHLDDFWMKVNSEDYKTSLIQPLFNQLHDNDLHSTALLKALHKVNDFLKSKSEVFKPFLQEQFNWANIPVVQSYLQSFLTEAEKKAAAEELEKEQKELEEKAKKEEEEKRKREKVKAAKKLTKQMDSVSPESEKELSMKSEFREIKAGQEAEEVFTEKEKTSWFNNLPSMFKKDKKEEEKRKREKVKAAKKLTKQMDSVSPESEKELSMKSEFREIKAGQEAEEVFTEKEKTSWFNKFPSFFNTKEFSPKFKNIAKEFDEKKIKDAFDDLIVILKSNRRLAERFCIEKTSIIGRLRLPGTSPQSLVHMYFFSEQILNYNVQLYRYFLPYEKRTTIPNNWHDSSEETYLKTVKDLLDWIGDRELPRINSDMQDFMQTSGIECRSYRQMVADHEKVNTQLFCESGYCQMRLVESLNPEYVETQLLTIKDRDLKSIGVNNPLRKLRAVMNTINLKMDLPQSTGSLQLAPYFPDSFHPKVIEWTEAAIVATGSEMLPRFFQRLFELRGNSMSIVDLQFTVNTIIEANRNFNVPLEALCKRILTKDGHLLDIFLALRVLGAMKGTAPKLDPLVEQLLEIKDSRLKALFGSKLHEMPITNEILNSLVKMLAHAEVAQLENLDLKEWVDIAKCQKWDSYAPLLKTYGTVGYYIVLLETMGQGEGQRMERIIKMMKPSNKKVIILEKVISMITFLISNNEVTFDDKYEKALGRFLQLLSEKCLPLAKEGIERVVEEVGAPMEDINSENICFVVNERLQRLVINSVSKEMQAVLPKKDRSLKDFIRLSINPQDAREAKEARQLEMAKIENMLTNDTFKDNSDIVYGEKLEIIDGKLYEIYGKHLRDTQKIAILSAALSQKNLLSQVNTGEGKSFIISCLAILRILVNKKDTVDIITSSSVLAQRDAETMKKLYEAFEIEVGHNCDEDIEKRKLAYKCGVVYGDIARFERDYLLHKFYKKNILGSRTRCNVIVDEVDSMLLDNGSNMLYLSHNVPGLEMLDSFFVYLHKLVSTSSITEADDGFSSSTLRQKILSDMCGLVTKEDVRDLLFDGKNLRAVGKVWRILVTQNVIDSEGVLKEKWDNSALAKQLKSDCGLTSAGRVLAMLEIVKGRRQETKIPGYLKQFVKAHLDEFIKNAKQGLFLKHNDEYVVDLDRTGRVADLHPVITIINKGTGTDLSTSQWSEGLHQFLQLKHGCRLSPISLKAVFVSNVTYLKKYKRLNGFSGTLGSVEESNSLVELYEADLLKIPTWKPKKFNENAPVLSTTREAWIKDIFDQVCNQVNAERSVLVICQSISKVVELNKEFQKLYKELECPSVAVQEAFEKVSVYTREFDEVGYVKEEKLPSHRIIISTNLAGRGTDIALSEDLAKAGGLHVIISFLPENSRIENQAYGRAARCGQRGSGQIICLVEEEDNGANNIFQLKQFRDNAEVHRLRSLKQFYDYHIAVEETALSLFKNHCSEVMESVRSVSEDPTIMQVFYFALLDEWAVWLDSKAEDIKQCEKNKNDGLKDHIIGSVKKFLEERLLPKRITNDCDTVNFDYSESLKWIKCPQPLISIALIHLQDKKTEEAGRRLDEVIKDYPDFQAEASYYKGVIEQRSIRKALQCKAPPEKDEEGKTIEGTPGIRLKVVNWLLREVLFSDDCPESVMQLCVEAVNKATEYFLLSRSLFATRIRKKHDMVRIVKMLQQNASEVISRGFEAQQEETIAVLECFIGNIDDIMGHRAKPEDVKLTENEDPHLTVRRFQQFSKRADIITPPQLANTISQEQLNILSNNYCLPVSALQFGFQKIYDNDSLPEYDGQKIIRADELAEVFPLPSLRGFWESLRRAGCFLTEQVFIAVKKTDKKKVPILNGIEKTEVKLNSLQVQLSTEDLAEYDLYDVHGSARTIREEESKNAELQEAQEAGLVHLEIIATINPPALTACKSLDQFSYLTVEEVAADLSISKVEAGWIMDTLVEKGIVEKRLAEIETPPTPKEIDAMNKAKQQQQEKQNDPNQKMKTAQKLAETSASSNSKENGVAKTKENKPTKTCVVYYPITRICCDSFPSNMRSSIQMILTHHFLYHCALTSLKTSFLTATEEKPFHAHKICLPTDPYADLCEDLQNLGVVLHSRVTSVLKDVYKPEKAETIIGYGFTSGVTDVINPVIYKKLQSMRPKLCIRKCTLVATSKYLNDKNVPASGEIRKIVSNGLRKVARIMKKNQWTWALGVFLKVAIVVVPLLILATIVCPFLLVFTLKALAIMAIVGTILYCMSLYCENQKMASTLKLDEEQEFHMLREYHESALDAPKRAKAVEKQQKRIEKTAENFVQSVIFFLGLGTRVSSSDEDISLWVDALDKCAQNSTHLSLLRQSIELWFKSTSLAIQNAQFNAIFNGADGEKKQLPALKPPCFPFAFSSILISEVNQRKKTRGRRKKRTISTKLSFEEFMNGAETVDPTEAPCPLSYALSEILKDLLTPMVEDNIAGIINPTLGGIDAAFKKSRKDKLKSIEQDESILKKRQVQHSAERLAKENTVDFLATDLHNIFQRILFREVSKPMLQHMIAYNYPMSPHCAKTIFDACVTLLQSIDKDLKEVNIELKRNDQTIFIYSALKGGCSKKNLHPLDIGLEKDSFYVLKIEELTKDHKKYHHGLFQALKEYSNKFSDNFGLDPQSFVDKLQKIVAGDNVLDKRWISSVSWNGNEKIKCAVAIW